MEWIVIALVGLLLVVGVVALLLSRSARSPRRRSAVRSLERERTIGYFRDLSGRGPAPGVQEEDRSGRWGAADSNDQPGDQR